MSARVLAPAEVRAALLADVATDLGWGLIERFSTLVRESGSADEHEAAEWIVARLRELGIPHEVHEPELYLSLPRDGRVEIAGLEAPIRGKPPSFAASTGPDGLTAPLVHVPAESARDVDDLFDARRDEASVDVRGRVVVTEGYAMPLSVARLEERGAAAQVYVNPGERVHWGICTPIWGTPSEEDLARKPRTPVVAVSRPDGERILERLAAGPADATVATRLEEGWFPCKLPVATIPGATPEFVLVHGHYDSWDVGVGDNAVGDATLLELARIFHANRDGLRRGLRIAWWPAHSTGRYAGSTWFADRFALDLRARCVAALNIDSPGCWHATAYEDVMWMAEAETLCLEAIREATGREATGRRPLRAGDYSFDQLGITSFFMLLSSIPAAERERLGFYPVGGCGGNIAWHTENDTLEVADRENLERDLRVYVTALGRVLTTEVLPFDFRATARELEKALETYREEAGDVLDLEPAFERLGALRRELAWLYEALEGADPPDPERANDALRELSRVLVPLNYAAGEPFRHDPALPRPPIPKLAGVGRLRTLAAEDPERLPFLQAGLRRRVNQVAGALEDAARAVARLRGAAAAALGLALVLGPLGCGEPGADRSTAERTAAEAPPPPSPEAEEEATLVAGEVEWSGPAGSLAPNLAATPDGRAVLTWLERRGEREAALRLAVRSEAGWSEPRTVRTGGDFFVNWADFPSLTALRDGAWAVHWLQRVPGGTYAYHVKLAVSRDEGRSWGEPLTLHEDGSPTEHGFVSGVLAPDGGAAFVWLDGREMEEGGPMTLRARALGQDGALGPEALLDARTCECCQTALAAAGGTLVAAYRDRSGEEVRDIGVVRAGGEGWSEPALVREDGWRVPGCPVNGPQLSASGERVVVAWFTAGGDVPRVQVAFSEDRGASFGDPIRVDAGKPVGRVDVELLPDGSAAVAWLEAAEGSGGVLLRRVHPDGRVERPVRAAASETSRQAGFPRMSPTADGLVLAWTLPGPEGGVRIRSVRLQ